MSILLVHCQAEKTPQAESKPKLELVKGLFMGMQPTATPKLLAPTLLASSLEEYNGTFSPDGRAFYFTTNTPTKGVICYSELIEDSWTTPRVASFSGTYYEYDPLFSPDGNRLYFSSERPVTEGSKGGLTNIWFVEREGKEWGQPQHIKLTGMGDYFSSLTSEGTIYFNAWETGDMFKATFENDKYNVLPLPEVLNSPNGEGDPFIAPDESYLIFRGYNNSLGNGDLYISFNINGTWTSPENLGAPINSTAHEMCPFVTTDGKYLVFASSRMSSDYAPEPHQVVTPLRDQHISSNNGEQNIYYISADFIEVLKAKNLGEQ